MRRWGTQTLYPSMSIDELPNNNSNNNKQYHISWESSCDVRQKGEWHASARDVTDGAYKCRHEIHTHTHCCHGSDNAMHRARNIEWLQRTRINAHMLLSVAIPFPLLHHQCFPNVYCYLSRLLCALPLMSWRRISTRLSVAIRRTE